MRKHCKWEDRENGEKGKTYPPKCLVWGSRAERREPSQMFGLRGNLGDGKLQMSYFQITVRNKIGPLLAEISLDEISCLETDFQMGY